MKNREMLEKIISLIQRLDLPDPDPHSYEGEWEARIAGADAARKAIIKAIREEMESEQEI